MDIEVLVIIIGIIQSLMAPFIWWVIKSIFEMKSDIALNSQSDEAMKTTVKSMEDKIDRLTESFNNMRDALLKGQVIDK